MATNPYLSQLADLRAEIDAKWVQYQAYSEEFNSVYSYHGNYTAPRAVELQWLRQNTLDRIDELKAELERITKLSDAWAKALAEATAKGLTGKAAEEAAKGLVEEAKTRKNLLTIGGIVVAVLLLGFAAWKWRSSRTK